MTFLDLLTAASLLGGTVFFLAGTVGVIRFPDALSRLHAVTKADNLGLGLVVLGLALQADSVVGVLRLAIVWFLVLLASSTSCYLVARGGVDAGNDGDRAR